MKKLSVFVMALLLLFSLASCGDMSKATPLTEEDNRNGEVPKEEQEVIPSSESDEGMKASDDSVELDDIDGNGQKEFITYIGEADMRNRFVFSFNEEAIYEHVDLLPVDIGGAEYMDLDHDGENEIVIVMFPHVNSMPLVEYAVIKRAGDSWKKLEMYQGANNQDNSFPIRVVKEEGDFVAGIYCEGQDTPPVIFTVENQYEYWKEYVKDYPISPFNEIVDFYEAYQEKGVGAEIAATCAYGVWDIQSGEYEGLPCLIAEQGIQGYAREDFWGNVFVYFDYDAQGKIHILDTKFVQTKYK